MKILCRILIINILILALFIPYLVFAGKSAATQVATPGDANNDGRVDGIDYVIWFNNYGQISQGGSSVGDFNNDTQIDGVDYVIWFNNYGFVVPPSSPTPSKIPTSTPAPSSFHSCTGPVVTLSGIVDQYYRVGTVVNGTTYDLRSWYSNAVGVTSSMAFKVGLDNGPLDLCVKGGVVNGHIDPTWDWATTHNFGGGGLETWSSRYDSMELVRIHNVEDGWKPREFPEFGNTGIMQMRYAYMTGIRDDSIENDDFMPGFVEDSLFDGVDTFLSEQNQSGGIPTTLGPGEDPNIRVTRSYIRLYSTNSSGKSNPGRWFKWQPRGTQNHNLVITDSVFATHGPSPRDGWSALNFPEGTTFVGTNYILWLGTPGGYKAVIPSGVIFLEGQPAQDKWSQTRNTWLTAHGYDPRPVDDWNPMDDPVVAPR